MTAKLFLIDASIYVFRGYFSIPDSFVSAGGEAVNAVYGYTNFLLDFLTMSKKARLAKHLSSADQASNSANTDLISVAFDESLNTCYRNDIYPDYKANREAPDENLLYQFECCKRLTGLMGLHYLSLKNYEADDIIGSLARQFGADRQTMILSRDKDLGQLLKGEDQLWDFAANTFIDSAGVLEKFGVKPEQIADYLALAGDTVDNIPGAPGIGGKTAAVLLTEFTHLENLLQNRHEIESLNIRGGKRLIGILGEHAENIRLYRQITGINCDIPITVSESNLSIQSVDEAALLSFCQEMKFGKRLQDKLVSVVK